MQACIDNETVGAPSAAPGWLRVWRPDHPGGIVVVHGRRAFYRCQPHGEYIVAHVARGNLDITRGAERYRMEAGDVAVWDPTAAHHGSAPRGSTFDARLLLIEVASFADIVADPDGCMLDVGFPRPVLRDRHVESGFLSIYRAFTTPEPGPPASKATLASWLDQLADHGPTGDERRRDRRRAARNDPALRRACELLRDGPVARIGLADLAAAAGTSKFRLNRLFTTGLGLPPQAYRAQLRVQRARTLLEAGHAPGDVAQLAGFYDQSHLNRHFTRRIGGTPACYARACWTGPPHVI